MLENIVRGYEKRRDELVEVMTQELGAPLKVSEEVHYKMGYEHFSKAWDFQRCKSGEKKENGSPFSFFCALSPIHPCFVIRNLNHDNQYYIFYLMANFR